MTSALDAVHETIGDWWAIAIAGRDTDVVARRERLDAARDAIRKRVLPYQMALVANANATLDDLTGSNVELAELTDALEQTISQAAAGEPVALDAWRALDNRAVLALTRVDSIGPRVEKLATAIEEPLAALDELERRIPGLRRRPFNT